MAIISKKALSLCLREYEDMGFSIKQEGDQSISLYFKDRFIAEFNATGISLVKMGDECQKYLDNINRNIPYSDLADFLPKR